jgi:hypothetical protein
MNSKISAVIDLLADGEWHLIAWLREMLQLAQTEEEHIMHFLEEFGLAHVDSTGRRAKINEEFKKLPELPTI